MIDRLAPGITAVYFEATQAGERDQLRRFGEALRTGLGPDQVPPGPPFATWEHALGFCAFVARSRPLVVVIDEATYLMESTPGFASVVQVVWDSVASQVGPQLMMVLTGSATGMVEDMLGYGGALYGRAGLTLRLDPLTVVEASAFVGHPDPAALLEAYAACGGYPLHLDSWDFEATAKDNLLRLAGSPGGLLLEDASLVLARLRPTDHAVISAIGQGRAKRSELANEVPTRIDRALDALIQARFVRAVRPLGAPKKARPEYRMADAYLRFWFRVLANHVQQIEAGQGEAVLAHASGEWQAQLGMVFEQAAREHAVELVRRGVLPEGTLVDEWWTTSGGQCQVDVLGMTDHRSTVIGEARWSHQPLGAAEVDALSRALRRVPDPIANPWLVLWGRGGVREEVKVGRVLGFGPADMLGQNEGT